MIVSVRDRVAPRLCSFGTASIGPSMAGSFARCPAPPLPPTPAAGDGGRDIAARSHCAQKYGERGTGKKRQVSFCFFPLVEDQSQREGAAELTHGMLDRFCRAHSLSLVDSQKFSNEVFRCRYRTESPVSASFQVTRNRSR